MRRCDDFFFWLQWFICSYTLKDEWDHVNSLEWRVFVGSSQRKEVKKSLGNFNKLLGYTLYPFEIWDKNYTFFFNLTFIIFYITLLMTISSVEIMSSQINSILLKGRIIIVHGIFCTVHFSVLASKHHSYKQLWNLRLNKRNETLRKCFLTLFPFPLYFINIVVYMRLSSLPCTHPESELCLCHEQLFLQRNPMSLFWRPQGRPKLDMLSHQHVLKREETPPLASVSSLLPLTMESQCSKVFSNSKWYGRKAIDFALGIENSFMS